MPKADPARLAHLLDSITEGWPPGKIPPEPNTRPYFGSIGLLNRRNARVVDLDGVQCLVWYHADDNMFLFEPRLRNPWFPAWHWPGVCLAWNLVKTKDDDRIIEQARACLPAVGSVRQVATTALSECEGRTRIFSPEGTEPDWGVWAEQYMLANALLGARFTPMTAQNMATRIKQAAVTYFGGTNPYDYSPVPERVWDGFGRIGWLAVMSGHVGRGRVTTRSDGEGG